MIQTFRSKFASSLWLFWCCFVGPAVLFVFLVSDEIVSCHLHFSPSILQNPRDSRDTDEILWRPVVRVRLRARFSVPIVVRIYDLLLHSLVLICVYFWLHDVAVMWYQLVEVNFIFLLLYFVSNLGCATNRIFSKTTTVTCTFNWKWRSITKIEAAVPTQVNGKSMAQQILLGD